MTNPFADQSPMSPEPQRSDRGPGQVDLVSLVKRALRGRYVVAAAAAAALAAPLSIAGYIVPKVTYGARMTVTVLEAPKTLIYDLRDDTERLDNYIAQQISQFGDQRVLSNAMEDPRLRGVGWPAGNEGIERLRDGVRIDYKRRESLFVVQFVDERPKAAEAGLQAVSEAYQRIVQESNSTEQNERDIDANLRRIETEIQNIEGSISQATASFGVSDLTPLIQRSEQAAYDTQQRIYRFEESIAALELSERTGQPPPESSSFTREQLSAQDQQLATLIDQMRTIEAEITSALRSFGSRHPSVKQLRDALVIQESRIASREQDVREQLALKLNVIEPGTFTIEQLRTQLASARETKSQLDAELRKLNQIADETRRDKNDLARLNSEKDIFQARKSQLAVERNNLIRGRVNVSPMVPAKVYSDKRKTFAIGGFGLGGLLGVGLVAGYGMFRRTFRYVDDIDDPGRMPPLLGTLPELDRRDPDAERIAAVSVHNLRNTLHAITGYNDEECQVLACTSAEPGDGKTTLVQSLGASYALTGLRTIIVDLDLIGGGLSSRLGMANRRGVTDLLAGLEPTKCIKRTATDKLYALPAGDRAAFKPEQLAHRPVQQIIDWLRERFDVVIIDTGPVLGSLEAGLTVSMADYTLLIVPRGQPDRLAKAAVTRLERLGAKRIGLVFNRADTLDLKQSLSAASIGAPSMQTLSRRVPERRLDEDASIVGSIPPPSIDEEPAPKAEDGTGR